MQYPQSRWRIVGLFAWVTAVVLGLSSCGTGGNSTDGDSSDVGTCEDAGAGVDAAAPGRPIVSNAAWTTLGKSEDPLAGHRPDPVECPDSARKTEQLQETRTLAIDTTNCNYFAGGQSSLVAIEKGDRLEVRAWHFELSSASGGDAHVAVLVDGSVVWESDVQIPAESRLLRSTWRANKAYPTGTDVTLHLHNHGANQWNFIKFVNHGSGCGS